jgi:peptide/nickel transport system substrate-binding protein
VLGYWADGPCYTRDLAKAQEYMALAGLAEGLDLTLAIQNTESEKTVGEIIQANLADIGINLTLDIQDDAAFIENGFGPDAIKNRQLVYLNWINFPDPSLYTYFFTCEQVEQWNWSYWCNEDFDRLHQEALREMDPAKRAALYIEMQQMMDEDVTAVYVANIVMYYVGRVGLEPSILPHGRVWPWEFHSGQ